MPNEELYRELYSKYAPSVTGIQLDEKIDYALTLDSMEFINEFYEKYTGELPSEDQVNYIKTFTDEPGKTSGTQEIDAPVVPSVTIDDTDLASELSSLGLS
jgi:hypothetical protein